MHSKIVINMNLELEPLLHAVIPEGEFYLLDMPSGCEYRIIYDIRKQKIIGRPVYNRHIDTEMFINWIRGFLKDEKNTKDTKH